MIHLLEVHPDSEIEQLKKLGRKLAMTGGYEVALKEGFHKTDWSGLRNNLLREREKYSSDSEWCSSIAGRIINLIDIRDI